jgi:hypothetical protein
MKIFYILFILININTAYSQAEKNISCAATTCTPDFEPEDQFEKIYHTSIDMGNSNESDVVVDTTINQSPRSLRLYVENNEQQFPPNLNLILRSKNEEFNAGDGFLIGDYFKNLNINMNGYSGILGKPASQICAEKFQIGGTLGYGDFARAEFQAKRISNTSIPINQCIYSDVEFLSQNNFRCDEEMYNEILSNDPTVSVRRLRGKNKCLGVGFQDVCVQRTVEVTCTWTLRYLEPANLRGQLSTNPSERVTKKFVMFENEFNAKYNLDPSTWGKYLCNTLTKGTQVEPTPVELVRNSALTRNSDNWALSGNTHWVNGKIKIYSGPILNDPSDGINMIKSIPGVGNPASQSFTGYNATVIFNFITKSPVPGATVTPTLLYQRSGFTCSFSKQECYYSAPPNGVYYNDLLLATVRLVDSNGYKSYYDIKLDIGYDYDQSARYVGGYGKKMRCAGGTASNSYETRWFPGRYTKNENNTFCADGRCFRYSGGSGVVKALRVYYPDASSYLVWNQLSGDWRRKCGGDYIYSVGMHFFLKHYPRASLIRRFDLEDYPYSAAEQVVPTEIGRTYRVTALMKSALEETRPTSGRVNIYSDSSKTSLIKRLNFTETGLKYPLSTAFLNYIDFTFTATTNSVLLEFTSNNTEYSAYFDDISVKPVSLFAGPPVMPTDPPIPNAAGVLGNGYYDLAVAPSAVRTTPGYSLSLLEPLPGSSWKVVYTGIGEECPLYGNKIKTNYLASHVTYDEDDNLCDDVSISQDPDGFITWRNIGFERRPEFGQETINCSVSSCPVSSTVQTRDLVLDTINTGSGISGTERGNGFVFIYDTQNLTSTSINGIPGTPGPNDLPDITTNRVCAKVQDAITEGEESEFAKDPVVQFKKFNWTPIKVIGQDAQAKIPKDNKKRVYIYKKIDSSVRYLLKQELL